MLILDKYNITQTVLLFFQLRKHVYAMYFFPAVSCDSTKIVLKSSFFNGKWKAKNMQKQTEMSSETANRIITGRPKSDLAF